NRIEAQNRQLKDQITQQHNLAKALDTMTNQFMVLSNTVNSTSPGTIVLEVQKFSGVDKNYTFKDFQTQVQIYFLNNPHLFTAPLSKMYFALSRQEGPALSYVEPFLATIGTTTCPDFLKDYDSLMKELKLMF